MLAAVQASSLRQPLVSFTMQVPSAILSLALPTSASLSSNFSAIFALRLPTLLAVCKQNLHREHPDGRGSQRPRLRMISVLRPPSLRTMAPTPSTKPGAIRVSQETNKNGPDHKFQVINIICTSAGETCVSAHLQRSKMDLLPTAICIITTPCTLRSKFGAIAFTMHPSIFISHHLSSQHNCHSSLRRQESQPCFLDSLPIWRNGRVSASSLKWNFQVGATCGVTKGPVDLALNPSVGYEKDTVVGTNANLI
jgi:hypothetical protein